MLIPRIGGFVQLFWKPVRRFDKWGILTCPDCSNAKETFITVELGLPLHRSVKNRFC